MDYSGLPTDEHVVGSSPWASSPDHNRTTFGAPGDIPSTPLPESAYTADQGTSSAEPSPAFNSQRPPTSEGQATNGAHEQQQPQQAQYTDQPPPQVQQPPRGQRYHGQSATRPPRNQPVYKLQAKVTGLERTGKKDAIIRFDVYVSSPNISSLTNDLYPLRLASLPYELRLNSSCPQTNLPKFRTTQFRDVRRTHSEFVKLGEHLMSANPEAMVPAVPPAATAAGAGTEEDEDRVKRNIQKWLNVVCSSEVLMRDEEMVFFVESDFGYSPVVRRKQPATGMRRKMIKQFAPPPDDTPELAEARPIVKLFYLGTMDAEQKLTKLVKARRGRYFSFPKFNFIQRLTMFNSTRSF